MQKILAEFGTIIAYYHTLDKVFLLGGLKYEVQQLPGDYVFLWSEPQSLGCEQHRTYYRSCQHKGLKIHDTCKIISGVWQSQSITEFMRKRML